MASVARYGAGGAGVRVEGEEFKADFSNADLKTGFLSRAVQDEVDDAV